MGSEFSSVKIGDHSTVYSGFAFKSVDLGMHGIPVVKIKNVKNRTVDISDTQFFPEPLVTEKHDKFFLKHGDVLIAMTGQGSVGRVGRLFLEERNKKVLLNQRVGRFEVNSSLDLRYLYYVLSSKQYEDILFNAASGSGQPNLSPTIIFNVEIPFVNINTQKAIAHILGSLDDKIELNRQMNQTLESMAQALFKSWFVDFDLVIDNALAEGNTIPDAFAKRAEARTNRRKKGEVGVNKAENMPENDDFKGLFPSEFEFTEEMGWIPKGWGVGKISSISTLNSKSWTKKNYPSEIFYVDLSNTKNGTINAVIPYSDSEAPSRARRILNTDDTIIGTVRPGNRSFAYIYEENLTGSTGFAVMSPLEEFYRSFLYLNLTQDEVIDHFAHLADGGAYPAIRPDVVADLEILIPANDIFKVFDSLVYPMINKIGKHEKQSLGLTKLRDTLLPKLLSGELRIPDAEKLISDAEV